MTVGIVGLGLIGGSFARVYSNAGHTVLVLDKDPEVLSMAHEAGAAHGELTRENAEALLRDWFRPERVTLSVIRPGEAEG